MDQTFSALDLSRILAPREEEEEEGEVGKQEATEADEVAAEAPKLCDYG